jgi:hypothetical protein
MSDQLDLFEDYAAAIHHGDGGKGGTQTAALEESQAFAVLKRKRALTEKLMEEVTRPGNLTNACQQVHWNGGAPGIDGMTVEELGPWLIKHQEGLELPQEWLDPSQTQVRSAEAVQNSLGNRAIFGKTSSRQRLGQGNRV